MKLTISSAALAAAIVTPAFAAPPAPATVPTSWTGFYGGIQFGGGWSDNAVNFSPNDPNTAGILNGQTGLAGGQPVAGGYRIPQSGAVGGFEAGYNWQTGTNWLFGLEADFSFSGMSGQATGPTSVFFNPIGGPVTTQSTAAAQSTDWYGTVRGRAGWLVTPNLLLFGAGGFAYGRTDASATYSQSGAPIRGNSFNCTANPTPCFAGTEATVRTGWTAGGGVEWLLDRHWSAKIEYQIIDLGSQTARVTALGTVAVPPPLSFNAAIRDQFNVVRLGLNYRF